MSCNGCVRGHIVFWPNSRLGLCVSEGGRLPRHTRMKSQNQDVSSSVLGSFKQSCGVSHLTITQLWQGEGPTSVAGCAWLSNCSETHGSASRGQLGDWPLTFHLFFLDLSSPAPPTLLQTWITVINSLFHSTWGWLCFLILPLYYQYMGLHF